jgi:DNA repair exonuclease SbcCD ATPase subunit
MAKPVDQAAELLYGLPLDEFTSARNATAKELRDRGLEAEAEVVKAFAKPTVPAWAVNQLTRRRHADLDELLDAATAARDAQLGGGADAREAIKRLRETLDGLVEAVRDELRGKASEAVLGKVRQTLEAATVDDQAAEAVRQGRLTKELEPAGFGTLAAHAGPGSKKKAQATPNAAAARRALAHARAKLREAEDELRAAQAEERQAHKRWQQAQGDAEEAAERVGKVRVELDALRSGT